MAGFGHLLHRFEKVAAGIGHQRRARRIEPSAILQLVLRVEAEEVGPLPSLNLSHREL